MSSNVIENCSLTFCIFFARWTFWYSANVLNIHLHHWHLFALDLFDVLFFCWQKKLNLILHLFTYLRENMSLSFCHNLNILFKKDLQHVQTCVYFGIDTHNMDDMCMNLEYLQTSKLSNPIDFRDLCLILLQVKKKACNLWKRFKKRFDFFKRDKSTTTVNY